MMEFFLPFVLSMWFNATAAKDDGAMPSTSKKARQEGT